MQRLEYKLSGPGAGFSGDKKADSSRVNLSADRGLLKLGKLCIYCLEAACRVWTLASRFRGSRGQEADHVETASAKHEKRPDEG